MSYFIVHIIIVNEYELILLGRNKAQNLIEH
jgi:hypothetical protein